MMNLAANDLAGLAWSQVWQVTVLLAIVAAATRLVCRRCPHLSYMPTGLFRWAQCRIVPVKPAVSVSNVARMAAAGR